MTIGTRLVDRFAALFQTPTPTPTVGLLGQSSTNGPGPAGVVESVSSPLLGNSAGAAHGSGSGGWIEYTFSENPELGLLGLLGLVLGIVLAYLVRDLVAKPFLRRAEATPQQWDDELVRAVSRTVFWGLLVGGLLLFAWGLTDYFFQAGGEALQGRIAWSALSLFALFVGFQFIEVLAAVLGDATGRTRSSLDDRLVSIAKRVLQIAVISVAAVMIVDLLGGSVIGLLVGLGVAILLALLFASDAVRNVSASYQLLADPPFELGDVIEVAGIIGTVRKIGLRATRLEMPHRSHVWVPNTWFLRESVENHSLRPSHRYAWTLDLPARIKVAELEKLLDRIRETLLEEESVARRPESAADGGRTERNFETDAEEADADADAEGNVGDDSDDREASRPTAAAPSVDPLVALESIGPAGFSVTLRYDLVETSYPRAAATQQSILLAILSLLEAFDIEWADLPVEATRPTNAGGASGSSNRGRNSSASKKSGRKKKSAGATAPAGGSRGGTGNGAE